MSGGRGKSRRVKPSPGARLRPFWVVIVLIVALATGAAAFVAVWPGFEPKGIRVSGNRRVSTGEILQRAAIAPHTSIWVQNTHAMAHRVEAIPEIAAASVRRVPPATLIVSVTERVPFAVVQERDRSFVVDRGLRVLRPGVGVQPLPVLRISSQAALAPGAFVTAADAVSLRNAYEVMFEHGLAPVALSFDRYGELVSVLPRGLRLLLGEPTALDQKLSLASAIIAQVAQRPRRVSAIDLRAPGTPVVVYR